MTETQVYNGDGITPSIVSGELSLSEDSYTDEPAADSLQAQTIISYDSQGQVWQTQVYSVNPTTGAVSSAALTTENYYDPNGNLIASSAPGGWPVMQYLTDGGSGTSYADASIVSSDVVLTQTTTGTTTITSTFNYDNQIASISSGTLPTYDSNGNMLTDQNGLVYKFNAWGEITAVYNSSDTLLENYSYDGLCDRMTNTVYTDDIGTTTNCFNSTEGQVLEEQANATGYYTQRYVWSPTYINSMVDRDTDTSGSGLTPTGSEFSRTWPIQDANYNTVALVVMSDDSATVVERYAYLPFGSVTYMNGSYTIIAASSYNWLNLFQGMRQDSITGNYMSLTRWDNPGTGMWMIEDPLGLSAEDDDLYRSMNNNAIDNLDPLGLYGDPWYFPGGPPVIIQPVYNPLVGFGVQGGDNVAGVTWPVQFTLPAPAGPMGGWIVQHVSGSYSPTGTGLTFSHGGNIWEMWYVEPGKYGPSLLYPSFDPMKLGQQALLYSNAFVPLLPAGPATSGLIGLQALLAQAALMMPAHDWFQFSKLNFSGKVQFTGQVYFVPSGVCPTLFSPGGGGDVVGGLISAPHTPGNAVAIQSWMDENNASNVAIHSLTVLFGDGKLPIVNSSSPTQNNK